MIEPEAYHSIIILSRKYWIDLYARNTYIMVMNTTGKKHVLERICGLVIGKPISPRTYRLWIGNFNPDNFCPMVTTVGADQYFVIDGKDEDDAIIIAYERLWRALLDQVGFVEHSNVLR